MSDAVNQIKERLTIIDVISPYAELHKAGKHYKARCPFHQEKTPSFTISPDRGLYHCYGCSAGGDMFTFIQEIEGLDFKGALKILAEKANVELVPEDPKKKTERDRQYDVLSEAAGFFASYLAKNPAALAYLTDRGVTKETIAKWQIGYAPGPPEHGWRETKEYLESKKFTTEELSKAGLIKGFDTGKDPYDLFRDRVMFPIFDPSGRVVAFSGRILTKDTEAPKYVNSPETELFNKSEILYGYDKAKQGIRQMDFSLIVEGQFDVVMTHQAGYQNAVAVSGTALTAHHVMLLQRLSNRVVLSLDGDKAGIAAVKRAADLMLSRGMDVKVAKLPDGKDPADIIHENKDSFKKVIGHAKHVIEYLLDVLEEQGADERTFKLKTREEILPHVVKIPNRIDQEHFENIIAERLGTTKDAIHFEVERLLEQAKNEPEVAEPTPQPEPPRPEAITKTEYRGSQRKNEVLQYLVVLAEFLPEIEAGVVQKAIIDLTGKPSEELKSGFNQTAVSKLSFEIEDSLSEGLSKDGRQDIIDRLSELRAILIREQIRERKELLKAAESDKDESKLQEILTELDTWQKQLAEEPYSIDLFVK